MVSRDGMERGSSQVVWTLEAPNWLKIDQKLTLKTPLNHLKGLEFSIIIRNINDLPRNEVKYSLFLKP